MVAFEPGRMTSVGVAGSGSPGRDDDQFDARLRRERVEIVEIGDARQQRHGDLDAALVAAAVARASRSTRILAGSRARLAASHGTTPSTASRCARRSRRAVVEQAQDRRGTC